MVAESQFFRRTEDHASKQEAEKPASMRKVVISQVDRGVSRHVRQDDRRGRVNADRLKDDDKEGQEVPSAPGAQTETGPPSLNSNEEREPGPDQGWEIDLHADPGQDE